MFDGTLNIDTAMSTKGFDTGVGNLIKGLKGLAVTATAVILGILGVQSVKSITVLSAEFSRLRQAAQAVGQMYGFTSEQSRKVIDDLVASGIQSNIASRAFINFAKEGLDLHLLPALARGAQDLNALSEAGQSSSDVFNGLLAGILKLDTQMLRNQGVVVDLFTAYKTMADGLGVTVEALTITERRQAAMIAVTEKLRGVTGLYELSQRTAAGQMSSNKRIMIELQNVLGGAFQDAFFNIIKSFNDFVKALTRAFREGGRLYGLWLNMAVAATLLSRAIRSIFETLARWLGIQPSSAKAVTDTAVGMGGMADAADAAAEAQGGAAKAIEKTAKTAKGALAAFDQLNVLQQDTPDTNADAGGGGGGGGVGDMGGMGLEEFGTVDLSTIEDPLLRIQEAADKVKQSLAELFKPLIESWERIKPKILEFGGLVWSGLLWVWNNVLVPFGEWIATTLAPVLVDLFGAGLDVVNLAIAAFIPNAKSFWDDFMKPMLTWVGTKIIEFLEWLTDKLEDLAEWMRNNPDKVKKFADIIQSLASAFMIVQTAMLLAAIALAAFGVIVAIVSSPILLIIAIIGILILVIILLVKNWDDIKKKTVEVWEIIKVKTAEFFAWFKDNWNKFWGPTFDKLIAFKEKWRETWDGIKSFLKGTINSIIDLVNGMVHAVGAGLNSVLKGLNKIHITIPSWIPIYGGNSWGVNLPMISIPNIPHLAEGAVIPPNNQFLAILGDQKSGKNIETPEALLRQIIGEAISDQRISIEFTGNLAPLIRELKPQLDRETKRIGSSLITGTSS